MQWRLRFAALSTACVHFSTGFVHDLEDGHVAYSRLPLCLSVTADLTHDGGKTTDLILRSKVALPSMSPPCLHDLACRCADH